MAPLSNDELRGNIQRGSERARLAARALYVAAGVLAVLMVIDSLRILAEWSARFAAAPLMTAERLQRLHHLAGRGGIAWGCVVVFCAMPFCRWLHLAYRNANAMQATRMAFTPREAVGAFLVPVFSVFAAYRALSDLRTASDPSTLPAPVDPEEPVHYRQDPLRGYGAGEVAPRVPLAAWWSALLLNAAARTFVTFGSRGTLAWAEWIRLQCVHIAAGALMMAAALLAATCVRALDARLVERARRFLAIQAP